MTEAYDSYTPRHIKAPQVPADIEQILIDAYKIESGNPAQFHFVKNQTAMQWFDMRVARRALMMLHEQTSYAERQQLLAESIAAHEVFMAQFIKPPVIDRGKEFDEAARKALGSPQPQPTVTKSTKAANTAALLAGLSLSFGNSESNGNEQ